MILIDLKKELILFHKTIDNLNEILEKKYNINSHPYQNLDKIPREGILENEGFEVYYKFHGGGCKFVHKNLVLDYQIVPITGNDKISIKFSIWKFRQFLESRGWNLKEFTTQKIFFYFEKLVEEKFLYQLIDLKGLYIINPELLV